MCVGRYIYMRRGRARVRVRSHPSSTHKPGRLSVTSRLHKGRVYVRERERERERVSER